MHRALIIAVSLALAAQAWATSPTADLYRQSYAAETKGDHAAALTAMDDLGARGVADYVYQLRRGWLLHLLGRSADALTTYQKAMALQPRAIEPKLGAMLPLMALRRWSETEKLCAEVLVLAPGDFLALSRSAYVSYQLGRWEKAASSYRQVVALYPSNIEMHAGLGWALLKQGKGADARPEFERILSVAPDHASAAEGLALVP
jgi:tetratricopeptide (TPR) repeat protein